MASPRSADRGGLTQVAREEKGGEGVSFETLLVASISSAVAAIVVSHFWQSGTVIAAAITPVLVALVGEGMKKPMRSERVRRSASRALELGSAPIKRTPGESEPAYSVYGGPEERGQSRLARLREGLTPKRIKLAIVTGLLAFVAAVAFLTLPELIFGGSVGGSDRNTTVFGGGSDEKSDERDEEGGGSSDPSGDEEGTPAPGESPDSEEQKQPFEDSSPEEDPPSEQPPPQDTGPAPPAPLPTPPPQTPTTP